MAHRTSPIVALLVFLQLSLQAQFTVFDSLEAVLEKRLSDDSTEVNILNQQAFDTYNRYPEEALRFAYKARIIAEKISYTKGVAEAYRQIGLVLWSQGNYGSALEILFKGLKLVEGDPKAKQNEADILGNIGLVYNSLSDYTQARDFLNRSIALQRILKNTLREAAMLNNIGDSYRFQGDFANALAIYRQALKLRIRSGNLGPQGVNMRNIGNVHEGMGNFDSAFLYYHESLHISQTTNDRRGVGLVKQALASAHFKLKQYDLAKKFASESLREATEDNLKAILRDSYKLLWQIAEAENNPREALRYYKLFSVYRDSVENVKASSLTSTVRLNHEIQKKQSEIDYLKKDSELRNARNARNIAILIIVILAVIMLAFLYFRQKSINAILSRKNKEIEEHEKEVEIKNKELLALNAEKNNLIGIVAHDLKNPLNQIKGLLSIVKMSVDSQNPEVMGCMETMDNTATRLNKMISRILDVEAIESKKLNLAFQYVDLSTLLHNLVDRWTASARQKNIEIHSRLEHQALVKIDPGYAEQVFENLLSNAIKFSPAHRSIYLTLTHCDHHVIFEIRDEGPGLTDDDKKKLFNRYEKLSARPTANEPSTGLGLSIVKKFVEAMNGKIWCESTTGKGAAFYVSFPQQAVEAIS
ncbi:MAG: tetratricopeptide repeat-containing sensor histidine kinase [Bacteroidota bacterium]